MLHCQNENNDKHWQISGVCTCKWCDVEYGEMEHEQFWKSMEKLSAIWLTSLKVFAKFSALNSWMEWSSLGLQILCMAQLAKFTVDYECGISSLFANLGTVCFLLALWALLSVWPSRLLLNPLNSDALFVLFCHFNGDKQKSF